MFWNSKPPAPAPAPAASSSTSPRRSSTSIMSSRSVHLSSYLNHSVLKPSTRKVSSDDTIYDTVFQTTNGFALIIRVYLPADGGRAPSMTLHGVRASHNWLDIRMKVIGYAPISSDERWRTSGLKLGDAVYAVIHHFQLTPPSILDITDANLRRLQETLSGPKPPPTNPPPRVRTPRTPNGAHAEPPRYANQPQQTTPSIVEQKPNFDVTDREIDAVIPNVPTSFLKIDNMTLSELNQLAENEKVLKTFVDGTPEVKMLKQIKQSIETSNIDVAKANLQREREMEGACADAESLRKDLGSKLERYRELDAKRAAIAQPPDRREAIRELNKVKKDAFKESERLADDWIDGGGEDVSGFVKKFMEVRLLYHARAAKAERLENSM